MGFRDSDNIIELADKGNVFNLAEPIDDGNVFSTDTGATAISSTSEAAASAIAAANSAAVALAASLPENLFIDELADINTTNITDGQVIQYEEDTSSYVAHTLTTSSITDIDNTNKNDGAVLLYDSTSNKYKATTQLNNANTYLIGGSF